MVRFSSTSEFEAFLAANAKAMASDILRHATESRAQEVTKARQVHENIRALWSDGFAALDAAVFAMGQHGLHMLSRVNEIDESSSDDAHQPVRLALALLQSSATVTLQEIRTLLEAGYWAGGAARWRALHETAVTAKLVAGGGALIAQRYLDHGFVVQTRRMKAYFDEHGVGPLSGRELVERAVAAAKVEQRNAVPGSEYPFHASYAWAVPLMPLGRKGKRISPTMDQLEKLVRLDHRRLLVATAHGLVHGDAAGVHAGVLIENSGWLLGPTERFVETVARPTLDTLIHVVAATHLGFEPEINEFAEVIALEASGLMALCGDAVTRFEAQD